MPLITVDVLVDWRYIKKLLWYLVENHYFRGMWYWMILYEWVITYADIFFYLQIAIYTLCHVLIEQQYMQLCNISWIVWMSLMHSHQIAEAASQISGSFFYILPFVVGCSVCANLPWQLPRYFEFYTAVLGKASAKQNDSSLYLTYYVYSSAVCERFSN